MKIGPLIGALAVTVALGAQAAEARPGYATANVNLRAGPDTDFPVVDVIPDSDPVDVRGCLNDESWCDVIWEGNRGWVFSEYLALDYRGDMRPLPDIGVEAFGIPIISFAATDYWGRYYVGRPWYRDRTRWYAFRPRPRPGWHAPPRGPRQPGWWRGGGYRAPQGMAAPPPDRGWKPHPRQGRPGTHDRRGRPGDHRDDRGGPGDRGGPRDHRR